MPRLSTILLLLLPPLLPSPLRLPAIVALAITGPGPEIRDIDGITTRPFAPQERANVLLFVASDCPISNTYAPAIQRICADYAAKGIACLLLYEDARIDPPGVRRHLADYRFGHRAVSATTGPATTAPATTAPVATTPAATTTSAATTAPPARIVAAIDRARTIATRAAATVTPQAVVIDAAGAIRYRGRIDNRYAAFGKPRQQITAHDLRDALDAVLDGRPVPRAETEALGCHIAPPDLSKDQP